MNFKQHRNYGITIALLASGGFCLFSILEDLHEGQGILITWNLLLYCFFLFVTVLAGSFAPDLDTDSIPSKIAARVLVLFWVVVLFSGLISEYTPFEYELQWTPIAVFTLIFLIAKSDKHRGITHALAWVPVLLFCGLYSGNHLIAAFAIGLAAHYYCDSINPLRLKNWF